MCINVLNNIIHTSYDVQLEVFKLTIFELGAMKPKKVIAIPKGDDSMIKLAQLLPIIYDRGVLIKDINDGGCYYEINQGNFTTMLIDYGTYNVISILHNDNCDLVILIQEDA